MVDYNQLTLFHGISQRMRYLSERQVLLAQNISNANTPGYVAKDLKKVDFANVLAHETGKLDMAVTNPAHIRPPLSDSDFKSVKKRKSFETTISGNNVVLEEQMQKLAENNANFQETTALYKKMTDIVRLATGANR